MGSGLSGLVANGETRLQTGLGDIPESCVATVLTHLDPPEICKLALLNRVFRRASAADCVWESKLPENYRFIVKKLFSEINISKRDIYARLCRSIQFDGGTKEVWMEKTSGTICVGVSWKGMKITGMHDRRYWNHIPTDESRFRWVAYLKQTWWLEVVGNLEFDFPSGNYGLYFRLRLGKSDKGLGRRFSNVEQIHGWGIKPVQFLLSTSDGQRAMSQAYLSEPGKWVNYHVGDFYVENTQISTKVKFSMTQIDCTHTKGGLCFDSVLILPNKQE